MLYEVKEYAGFDEENKKICWKVSKLVDEESNEACINKQKVMDITRIFSEFYSLEYVLKHSICLDNLNELRKFNIDLANVLRINRDEQIPFLNPRELYSVQSHYFDLKRQIDMLNEGVARVRK